MTTTLNRVRLCLNQVRRCIEPKIYNAPAGHIQPARGMRLFRERTIRLMYWRGRSHDLVKYKDRRPDEFQTWNYKAEIFAFSRRLQENLSEDTLRKVFIHQCYAQDVMMKQQKLNLPHVDITPNTAMIQRGDRLLAESIEPYLRHIMPSLPEDGVKAIRDYLKSEVVLADIASWIGCKDIILSTHWPPKQNVMATTVLALLAGIETDLGLERVQRFVVDMIISYLNDKDILDDVWQIPNPKETLNLILKNSGLPAYEPRIVFQTGIKTIESCYVIGLYTNQQYLGSSPGETIEIAEECAALTVLQKLFGLTEHAAPFVYGEQSEAIDYSAHKKEHEYIKNWKFQMNK